MPPKARGRLALSVLLALAACAPPRAAPAPEACPPDVERLVDLGTLDPAPVLDVRYATAHNFTGSPLPGYAQPRALLRPRAAEALERVGERLRRQGYGLKVWDAYRPVRATLAMVEWAEGSGNLWVLEEGYVARRSGHNRGTTVDLTLVRLDTGEELDMGTAYDHFSEAAHTANAVGEVLRNRRILLDAMAAEGWENYPKEWWHFSLSGEDPPLDVPLHCFP